MRPIVTPAAQLPVTVPVRDEPARLEWSLRPTEPYRVNGYRYQEF
jgi:hypothetical protein